MIEMWFVNILGFYLSILPLIYIYIYYVVHIVWLSRFNLRGKPSVSSKVKALREDRKPNGVLRGAILS